MPTARSLTSEMRYTIRYQGVPVGNVELAPSLWISAGSLELLPGYGALRQTIRAGSSALFQLGFFGATARALAVDDAESLPALNAAAALAFDMVDGVGKHVPTTFINLIEPPDDTRVIVLARIGHAHAEVVAAVGLKGSSDSEHHNGD